jgi:hypothetical protein
MREVLARLRYIAAGTALTHSLTYHSLTAYVESSIQVAIAFCLGGSRRDDKAGAG